MNALILVDVQNDFLPGGSLAVPEGDLILPKIETLLKLPFDYVCASLDWHPRDHNSFASNHGREVGERVMVKGVEQILWPDHCIQNSHGAELVNALKETSFDEVTYKGTDPEIDSYSVFFDNGMLKSTGLEGKLREKGIKTLYFAGLATDYCVKYSALDAIELGFNAYVVVDACRGVNLSPHDVEEALAEMQEAGAILIRSDQVQIEPAVPSR